MRHTPEDAAWEQDLIVQLLGGSSTDGHTLLIVHLNMVPHVVGGGNWADMIYLQHRQRESKYRRQQTLDTWNVWVAEGGREKLHLLWFSVSIYIYDLVFFLLLHKTFSEKQQVVHSFPFSCLFTLSQLFPSTTQYRNKPAGGSDFLTCGLESVCSVQQVITRWTIY